MKYEKIIDFGLLLALVVAVAITAYAAFFAADGTVPAADTHLSFHENWSMHSDAAAPQSFSLSPAVVFSGAAPITLSKTLPAVLPEDALVVIRANHAQVTASLGGISLPVNGTCTNPLSGALCVSSYVSVPLRTTAAGHLLTLEIASLYPHTPLHISDIYLINRHDFFTQRFVRALLPAFFAVVMLTLSALLFAISVIYRRRFTNTAHRPFIFLSLFVFLAAMWILFDSGIPDLLWGYHSCQYFISFYTFMLLPIPFSLFVREIQPEHPKVLNLLCSLQIFSFLLSTGLLMLGVTSSLIQTIFLTHLLIAALSVVTLHLAVSNYRRFANSGLHEAIIGMLLFVFTSAVALAVFYSKYSSYYAPIFSTGLFLLVVFLSISVARHSLAVVQRASDSELNLAKASHAENILQVSQINTHFFYHIMSATRALIKTNPDIAYKMLGDFSKYLRYETDSSAAAGGLTKFSEEMQAIRAYVDLKKVVLGSRLAVVYQNSGIDFYIPVLTVQPLVENAIVHGIEPKAGGGTVCITVREEPDFYVVVIEDDGCGFVQETEIADDCISHRNIKARLAYYGGNIFSTHSIPGRGTRVELKFTKNLGGTDENNLGR